MHVNMPADVTWFVEVDRWNACEHASGCQLVCWKWSVGMHVNMPADVSWFVEVERWNPYEHASGCQLVC